LALSNVIKWIDDSGVSLETDVSNNAIRVTSPGPALANAAATSAGAAYAVANVATAKANLISQKSISIFQPAIGDNVTMLYTENALTMRKVVALVKGSSPNVYFSIRTSSADGNTANIQDVFSAVNCTNTTFGISNTTTANASVAPNTFVWCFFSGASGTIQEFHASLFF